MNQSHKMKCNGKDMGRVYLDRLADEAALARAQGLEPRPVAAEAARMRADLDAGWVPEACGPAIAATPPRGGFVLVENVELLPVGSDKVEAVHRGYGGRAAVRRADVFDAMEAAALRRKQPCPLSPAQIAIGRRYHDLVELLTADGTKLSQLQGSFGSSDSGSWMDRRLELAAEVEGMRRRIGVAPAIGMRRIRPSLRGAAAPKLFTKRDLVDHICLKGKSVKETLVHYEWQANGRNCKAAVEALREALDAMIGYRGQKSS